jgi:50S ribosome-binding GTPase
MNSEYHTTFVSKPEIQIRNLSEALRRVFGESAEGHALLRKCRIALEEITSQQDHRGVKSTILAVIGSKNAGKSWLCRELIRDDAKRARIPSGEEDETATEKATWIGPDAPPLLAPEHELRIPAGRDEMLDLGRDYTLLDLPGYDDAGLAEREAALRALRGVEFRILVISSKTKSVESQFAYLRGSNGTRILPVMMDSKYPLHETEGRSEVAALLTKIRRNCPQAEVSDVLIIPHVEHAPGDAESKLARARDLLFPALRAFIALPPVDESVAGWVVLERLRKDLLDDLREFISRVGPAHEELVSKEAGLARELVGKIVGEDPQLAAGLRMKMRLYTLAGTPAWFFPYRTFFGAFTFTAGAWDRLAFAMAGSLPSLTLLAFQTARNAKRMGEMQEDVRRGLAERLQRLADDDLASSNQIFVRSIYSTLPKDLEGIGVSLAPTRFVGLERVISDSAGIFDSVVSKHSCPRGLSLIFGGLATLGFIALAAGPLWVVYREFFQAWSGGLTGMNGVKWTAFPAPSAGMIFATLLLVLLPCALLALVSSVIATPQKRIAVAADEVRQEHNSMLEKLARSQVIRLESDDPIREAVRLILGFLSPKN